MSLGADRSYKMKLRDVENAFKYRRIPYPKRSVELIALLAISCTFFLFMHTNKLNSRLKEMEVKLQPSEFSALGLTGNHVSGHDAGKHDDINTLHGTYQYLKSTGQLWRLNPKFLNNTKYHTRDILFFNRVPKTGSETLIELMLRLGERNRFQNARSPFSKPTGIYWSFEKQKLEAHRILDLMEEDAFAYAEHANYMNFRQFQLPQPIYINLIRDPVERVISWYYYKRTPWNSLQMFKITGKFENRTHYQKNFEDCVLTHDFECRYDYGLNFKEDSADHKRQSLFFCGHAPLCEPFNTPAAVARAKQNVERDFSVVGSWEDVNVTLAVLEHFIPRFFRGSTELYYEPVKGLAFRKRNTNHWKPKISERIKRIMRANFTQEYDFYYFCKQRLYRQYFSINRHLEL
ncbi:heparan sulfate 2-O-sulfotransferase pipe-like isoform X7 [Drosophila guanche]|uniref:heparan sulfate 2-O-sulfotransferase pipe-like isoform X7 n=1 Tax=Drosophila guanche TaxID=7266 RepID=UPI00147119C1|nr:heparan sulfate 2-O-sulfotransferase pipe-like isoform X7 [Drosophila guanche]